MREARLNVHTTIPTSYQARGDYILYDVLCTTN